MARKVKLPLELSDGTKVKTLEELREHFGAGDGEKLVGYLLDGMLLRWLNDRYYEAEATAIEPLGKDTPNLLRQICSALGLPCDNDEDIDPEEQERLNEKIRRLKQLTADAAIIANAAITAFDQEDLSDLIDNDEETIYLCGESFAIPASVRNKKYVGILGQPKVSINAKSADELTEKNIVLENVVLPASLVHPAVVAAAVAAASSERPSRREKKRASGQTLQERLRNAAHEEWDIGEEKRSEKRLLNAAREEWEIGEEKRSEKRLLNVALDEWGDFPFGETETAWKKL